MSEQAPEVTERKRTLPEQAKPYMFKPGNQAAAGKQNAAKALSYKKITREECDHEKWRAIVRKATEQALDGDRHARAFLSEILVGKPKPNPLANIFIATPEEIERRINALFGMGPPLPPAPIEVQAELEDGT